MLDQAHHRVGTAHPVPFAEVGQRQTADHHHAVPLVFLDTAPRVDHDGLFGAVADFLNRVQLALPAACAHGTSMTRRGKKPDRFESPPLWAPPSDISRSYDVHVRSSGFNPE